MVFHERRGGDRRHGIDEHVLALIYLLLDEHGIGVFLQTLPLPRFMFDRM